MSLPSAPCPEPADADDRQQGGIQVIARMSRILRALSAHPTPGGMSLAAIAAEVELPRSTVQRIVTALVAERLVEPAGASGFRMGTALGQMLYQTHTDIVPLLKPHAEALSIKLQETVCIARLQLRQLHLVDAVIGEQALRVVPQMVASPPPHITAAGKALLARMDDASVAEWLAPEALPPAQQTAVLQAIAAVRQAGYATDWDDVVEGVGALAITVGTYRGAYALVVLAPSVRMHREQARYLQALFALRDTLDTLLGLPLVHH